MADEQIDPAYKAMMNDLAKDLDMTFNGGLKGPDRTVGFALFIFRIGQNRANYISNCERSEMIAALEETLQRFKSGEISDGKEVKET